MVTLYKKIKIWWYNLAASIISWIAINVWTLPIFVSFLEWTSQFQYLHGLIEKIINTFNRFVEDYVQQTENEERRVAVIIGADSAIGYSLATQLVKKNFHVVIGVKNAKTGIFMSQKLHKIRPYSKITPIVLEIGNPYSAFDASARIKRLFKRIDVIYFNNYSLVINRVNWPVLYDAIKRFSFNYFCMTGRSHPGGPMFISTVNKGTNSCGFGREFAESVLGPFIMIKELLPLIQAADLPGRIVWSVSSFLNPNSFDWHDPQHLNGNEAFFSNNYIIHLLQPMLNRELSKSQVQSYEGSPGLVLSSFSPENVVKFSSLFYILSYFVPIIRVSPYYASRCLLHLGTHRREYEKLQLNKLYYMTNYFGLKECTYVEEPNFADSAVMYNWLEDIYNRLRQSNSLLEGRVDAAINISHENSMNTLHRRHSLGTYRRAN
ncbi:hypothetical protein WA158_003941 [Blastocystis sp. Blastoise]